MKLALLFSSGKDSTFAGFLAKKYHHELTCLITMKSENPESYMFHTPSIPQTPSQAKAMQIPLIIKKTKGKKEQELKDLEQAIKQAIKEYKIEGIITGAVESIYQSSRIQKICNKLKIECFNPLWQKNQIELLEDLLKNKFKIIITGVAAYPLTKDYIGKQINKSFIKEVKELNKKYQINPAGEGGEFETFVLNCPLFKHELKIKNLNIQGEKNNFSAEIELK